MPWVVREAVRDVNRAVGRRWHAIDPLLPDPGTLPTGCGEPLVVTGDNGRLAALGVRPPARTAAVAEPDLGCRRPVHAGSPAARQDIAAAADLLLTQWRDHLAGVGATAARTPRPAWSGRAWTSPASTPCSGTDCSRSP